MFEGFSSCSALQTTVKGTNLCQRFVVERKTQGLDIVKILQGRKKDTSWLLRLLQQFDFTWKL